MAEPTGKSGKCCAKCHCPKEGTPGKFLYDPKGTDKILCPSCRGHCYKCGKKCHPNHFYCNQCMGLAVSYGADDAPMRTRISMRP